MSLTSSINWSNLNFLEWDYPAIYEGVMSPENNFIMIIQNIWLTITSSIGYLFLIPFYNVSRSKIKWDKEEEEKTISFFFAGKKSLESFWFSNLFFKKPIAKQREDQNKTGSNPRDFSERGIVDGNNLIIILGWTGQ